MSTIKIAQSLSSSSSTFKCVTTIPQLGGFHGGGRRINYSGNNNKGFRRRSMVSMSSTTSFDPFQICVKASVITPTKLGDCPFCQRVLLTLEEKRLPYDMKLVDLTNKPDWFKDINPDGKVPVIKFDDKWVADSDFITTSLEEKFPDPPLATPPEKATIGSKIFPSFVGFLKSKDPSDGKEQELLNELNSFNDHLKENGPFINGKQISAADLALGPKLYHMEIALRHYKNWSVPDSLSYVNAYMKSIFSRDSFTNTAPSSPQDVVVGWSKHVN